MLVLVACSARASASPSTRPPATPSPSAVVSPTPVPTPAATAVETVATGLQVPWALAFAPDGRLFLTERPGRIRVIERDRLRPEPVAVLPVTQTPEGGLMGLALDPDFSRNAFLYVMYTYRSGAGLQNRISRLRLAGNTAGEEKALLDGIPGGDLHDGGRVRFGPDGKLYASMGDASRKESAQDARALTGKLLRLNPDGTIPSDNPFPGSPVYALGVRNSQGFDWQSGTSLLFATNHGADAGDQIYRIEPGANYGWPRVEGEQRAPGFLPPLLVIASPEVAPAGASFYRAGRIPQWTGSFFFATLVGRHLHRVVFAPDGNSVAFHERLYAREFGRLRDVVEGPDGALYFTTSNRDGRGQPGGEDDRILRVVARP